MIDKVLQQVGLSRPETLVYLSCLQLGPRQPVSTVARKSGMTREYAYPVVQKLAGKGLLTLSKKEGVKRVTALHPKHLLDFMDSKAYELKRQREALEKSLPQLEGLLPTSFSVVSTSVDYFEGREGIQQLYSHNLKIKEDIRAFTNWDAMMGALTKSWADRYIQKRVDANMRFRCITVHTRYAGAWDQKSMEQLREMKFLPKTAELFPTEILIYGDYVAAMAFGQEMAGILVYSPGVAATLRTSWDALWGLL